MLRGSWDSVKQVASALASALHRVVDFKPKTRRFANGAFDDDLINTPEQAVKVNVCLKTIDTVLMQLNKRFSFQQLDT